MAYRFKLDEPFEKGFRRIAREQIDRALAELSPLEVGPRGVHESRKALKRLRALLRLVAPAIGKKSFDQRNQALRKAANLLSARRDETVILDTIQELEASTNGDVKAALGLVRERLSARDAGHSAQLDSETAQQARLLLVKEGKRLAKTAFEARGFDAVLPGLEASYRGARKTLKKALSKPSDEALHDLRKAVQWHWRQMALLSRAWPEAFAARVLAARELSQLLGDDHDLAMLANAVTCQANLDPALIAKADGACRDAQKALREGVEFRAERLFAETPRAFCRRVEAYWAVGRHIVPLAAGKHASAHLAPPAAVRAPVEGSPALIAAIAPASQPSQLRA